MVNLGNGLWVNLSLVTHVVQVRNDNYAGTVHAYKLHFGAGSLTTEVYVADRAQVQRLEDALKRREVA